MVVVSVAKYSVLKSVLRAGELVVVLAANFPRRRSPGERKLPVDRK